MKKKKILNLTVPEPCPRKWEDMNPNNMGRHCAGCDKTLTDFTTYSDRQLIEYFAKAKHGLCGMFNNEQLNRTIVIPTENNSFMHKALLGTALVAGLSASVNAQVNNQSVPAMQVPIPVTPTNVHPSSHNFTIHGKLIDAKTKEPIDYADIRTKEIDSIYEQTDTDGTFTLQIPENYTGGTITFFTNLIYYHNIKQQVDLSTQQGEMVIELRPKHRLFRKRRTFRTIGCPCF